MKHIIVVTKSNLIELIGDHMQSPNTVGKLSL